MTPADFLLQLRNLGVKIWIEGDQLRLSAPKNAVTPQLRAQLKERKAELIRFLRERTGGDRATIPTVSRNGDLPVSFAQQGLWFVYQFLDDKSDDSSAYNIPQVLALRGGLDTDALAWSLGEVVRRHESLRTTFALRDDHPQQVIAEPAEVELPVIDVSSHADPLAEGMRRADEAAWQGFDLAVAPLFRCRLVRIADDEHLLAVAMPHIVGDGWSYGVFWREVGELYAARVAGTESALDELPIQYADHAAWQRQWYSTESDQLLEFWRSQLADLPTLEFPTDRPRPSTQTFRGARHSFSIPKAAVDRLSATGREEGCTFFMTMLAVYKAWIARYTDRDDIVVGTPIANRHRAETEPLIGLFVNSLVLRTDVSGDPDFRECLRRVRETAVLAYQHPEMPFEQLVLELSPERDPSRNPLFQLAFTVDEPASEIAIGDLDVEFIELEQVTAKFDLTLGLKETSDGMVGIFEYNCDLFDEDTVRRMGEHFCQLLAACAEDPDACIWRHAMLTAAEHELLIAPNYRRDPFEDDLCVHDCVAQQAAVRPDALAVSSPDGSLTFSELDRQANQIAHYLRARGIGPDVVVAVLMERTPLLIAAMLGVLKAGGAYVPLDPANPARRQQLVLEDAEVPILLTQESLAPELPDFEGECVVLDRDDCPTWKHSEDDPGRSARFENVAAVIFTSGSTGRPKGVEIRHKSLLNLSLWSIDLFGVTPDDRASQAANQSFDAAMWEVWSNLIAGASLHQPREEVRKEPGLLLSWLAEQRVTLCFQTTSLAVALWKEPAPRDLVLRWVLAGGEKMKYPPPLELPYRVLNVYGPTECTIYTTTEAVPPGLADDPAPSIGRAVRNVETWILDRHLQPVPIGVPGELYIGGDGLSRGYHNRPELTAERYVPHPFVPGERVYKTGDMVRYMRDSRLEFLGRVDHQIKLRGFRIELDEIEHVLGLHPDVEECALVSQHRRLGDMQIAAYVVLKPGATSKIGDLRTYLYANLPDYMVPGAIVLLDAMPKNPNGKVDRDRLSAGEAERGSGDDYLPPRTPLEERLTEIWKSVLDVERVGREDKFFDLGGHSLLIVRLQKKLREVFDTDLTIAEMFHYPTVAALAERLGGEVVAPTFSDVQERAARVASGVAGGAHDAIAVVGMSGRFPDARDLSEFWANISGGLESISYFTDDDLRHSRLPTALWKHPDYVKARAILDDIELFDAAFFGINAREAQATDPQQRLFLEVAYEAIESAGYDPLRCPRGVGVFGGCGPNSYYRNNLCANREFMESIGALETSLIDRAFLTTRVAYQLNLKGPALDIYSACSTSLAAIVYACQSLQDHHCDMALAGGVSVYSPQRVGHLYREGQIFSPDGHCRPFDAKAKGTLSGEAVGVVVLKRLSDALADGDHVHAVIKGLGINNDGSDKVGFTAPSVEGQAEAIAMALAQADASPDTIDYVEAHGTATPLGDPVEIAALTRAYRAGTDKVGYCAIGSVKSNIGHTDTAAGVAGFIKAVLSLENRVIPPSLNYEKPNPEIDFETSPFFVNTGPRMWKADDTPRRAGVSSFGIGGTNVHLVLEEAPPVPERVAESAGPELVVFSAKTKSALQRATDNLAAHLTENRDLRLADLAFTAQQSRSGFIHRRAVVCRDLQDAIDALAGNAPDRLFTGRQHREDPPVVFMFPGQGAQYVGMGRDLYDGLPVFREYLDKCADALAPELGFDLREVLFAGEEQAEEAAAKLEQTGLTQPAIFSIEYALAQQWMAWGVRPAAMIGHSVGEYVAATLADVLSLEDALRLVAARGRMMQALPPGDMLSVPLSEDEVQPLLGDEVSLAAVNGPTSCVVSGPAAAVGRLNEQLAAKDLPCRLLHTSHAFHSSMMAPIVEPFAELVKQVRLSPARIDCVSTVTGERIAPEDWADPAYWARNLREPVRFSDGAEVLLEGADHVLLEVGPGQTLNALVRQHKAEAAGRAIVASMRHPQKRQPDLDCLLAAAGRLWIAGVELDWQQLQAGQDGGQDRRRVALPSYPFARERYWIDPSPQEQEEGAAAVSPAAPAAAPAAIGKRTDVGDWFSVPSWRRTGAPRASATTDDGWLVLTDAAGLGERLVARLRSDGKRVVTVSPGDEFAENGENGYIVRPESRADFDSLMAALRGRGVTPGRVVHLWNVVAAAEPAVQLDSLDRSQSLGFYSTLFLVQALGDAFAAEAAQIDVVTNDLFDVLGGEAVHPERATVLGPIRVVPQEYENLRARCIDVQLPALDSPAGERVVNQLIGELSAEVRGPFVAYRGAHRWAEAYEPMHLDAPEDEAKSLREGGVYLITGGLGGIGLVAAEHLAEVARAKLVLVGRSGLPPKRKWDAWLKSHGDDDRVSRRIRSVRKLEELGSEVVVASADVSNLDQMREVVGRARVRFGAIHGVIHAAGLSTGGIVAARTAEAAAEVLAPKVKGTLVLRDAVAGESLDFFVMCSSGSSILGGIGGADYCAANAFLDALAHSSDLGSSQRFVAVNWDAWSEVGMSAEIDVPEELRAGRERDLAVGIRNDEGKQVIARILADLSPQLVVITRDIDVRLRESREQGLGRLEAPAVTPVASPAPAPAQTPAAPTAPAPKRSSTLHPRPELPSEYVAPRNATEQTIATAAQDLLGIEMVGINDNFFDLGFDSLLAHRMIGRLKETLSMAIPLRVILEMPTVGELANFVDGLGSSLATSQATDP